MTPAAAGRTSPSAPPVVAPSPFESGGERHHSNDLGLELYRQRTLLQILTARLRESANGIDRGGAVDPARIRRALDVHRRYLVEVHQVDAERLTAALTSQQAKAATDVAQGLRRAKEEALEYERRVEELLASGVFAGGENARRLSKLMVAESDRIDRHQTWESEKLHARIDEWFPKGTQARLLGQIRKFDSARVDAEIALISWASQIHPSSD